LIWIFQIGY